MSNATLASRKENLESHLSNVCGLPVELTVRGEREFTLSSDGNCKTQLTRAAEYFGTLAKSSFSYDEECDFSCLYLEV